MIVGHNLGALSACNRISGESLKMNKSMEKLSSGMKINKASDNAAGLAISEKMRSQIRGLSQAGRNIQDAISLIQTAEGGLGEIHSLLQRGRELAVQSSNGTNNLDDRNCLQLEMNEITKEIDRISNTTQFNTINLLNTVSSTPQMDEVLNGLKDSWLKQSINRIQNEYGITPDNVDLNINLIQGSPGGVTAYVSYSAPFTSGYGTNLSLNIEMADYSNGKIGGEEADRTIAHEMVHAVMARTMDMDIDGNNDTNPNDPVIPTWFKEGTAEFIHGADDRLFADTLGGTSTLSVMNAWNAGWPGGTGTGSSKDYSAAYAAVRYLHDEIKSSGGNGIKDIMTYLAADNTRTLDDAITNASSGAFANLAAFNASFSANGSAFILNPAKFNLVNSDTGAIGGSDADGGPVLDGADVIPDTILAGDPTPFNEIWPSNLGTAPLNIQLGANSGQSMLLQLSAADSNALGVANIDIVTASISAISIFDSAIDAVSNERARFGALQNRLEHAMAVSNINFENTTSSESRIRDTDFAREMMIFTRESILKEAASAMLAQANEQPKSVLKLLSN